MHSETKRLLLSLSILFILISACTVYDGPPPSPPYGQDVRFELFYDSLTPYGEWILLDSFGWVWLPQGVGLTWRPYTHGRWIFTDVGWTWASSWTWGWAPFHYGRWLRHSRHGWVWIPGRRWAPAWVAWRAGDGWFGWAPLPPTVHWRVGVGFDLGAVEIELRAASDRWSFIAQEHLIDRNLRPHLAPMERNSALLGRTRDITRYQEQGQRIVERGLTSQQVEQALKRQLPRHRIEELDSPTERGPRVIEPQTLRVYRPRVDEAPPSRTPRRTPRKGKRGRGANG